MIENIKIQNIDDYIEVSKLIRLGGINVPKNPLRHLLNVYFIILKFDEFSKNDIVHSLWCHPSIFVPL